MSEKLIFPIGFDLEEGVKEASKEWKSTYQKQLQKAIDDKPLKVKIDFESKGIDTKEFKQWMVLSREAEKLERERIKNAKEWQKVTDQAAMAETRRANAVNESNARIERANRKVEASEKRKSDAVERTNAAYKTQSNYLSRLFQRMVAYASVAQVMSFLRNIREVTAEFELQRVALGALIQDAYKANQIFEQIKVQAIKSPYEIKELVTYTKQLAAYGVEADDLVDTMNRLADIAAGLGTDMDRIILAYGQIQAAGVLKGTELRQLTELGLPMVDLLAEYYSVLRNEVVTTSEVFDMISNKEIPFEAVSDILEDLTSEGGRFYEMQSKQAETLAGQWSNMKDALSIMFDEIGRSEEVRSLLEGMIDTVKWLALNWREVWKSIKLVGGTYVTLKSLTLAQKLYNASLTTTTKGLRRYLFITIEIPQWWKKINKAMLKNIALNVKSLFSWKSLTVGIKSAIGALKQFVKTLLLATLSNPIGWITGLASVIGLIKLSTSDGIDAMDAFRERQREMVKDAVRNTETLISNFKRLANEVVNSTDGSEQQAQALRRLKQQYGEIFPDWKLTVDYLRNIAMEGNNASNSFDEMASSIRSFASEEMRQTLIENFQKQLDEQYANVFALLTDDVGKNYSRAIGVILQEFDKEQSYDEFIKKVESEYKKLGEYSEDFKGYNFADPHGYDWNQLKTLAEAFYNANREVEKMMQSFDNLDPRLTAVNNQMKTLGDTLKKIEEETGGDTAENVATNIEKARKEAIDEATRKLLSDEGLYVGSGITLEWAVTNMDKIEKAAKEYGIELSDAFYLGLKQLRAFSGDYDDLWREDLANMVEYLDEGKRKVFAYDPQQISGFGNLDDALTSVGERYKDLEKELDRLKKTSEALNLKPIDEQDTKEIENYRKEISKTETIMRFLYNFLEKYGGLDLIKDDKKSEKVNPEIKQLEDELAMVEKIYKKYEEYRKTMGDAEAKALVEEYFKGVDLKWLDKAFSSDDLKKQSQEALRIMKTFWGDTKKAQQNIQFKIGDIDYDETKRELEQKMKKLSDDISRTKTAKEFFDRMLGMTGDKELSATLTLSVYGTTGDDLQKLMSQQIIDAFKGVDITDAMLGGNKWDYNVLAGLVEHLPEAQRQNAQSIVDNWRKANADILTDLQKSYEDFMTYEERKTRVVERQIAERKKIEESQYDDDEKAKLIKASEKSRDRELADIAIEEFKASEDWAKSFEDLENLATPTIERLMTKLKEFIDLNKEDFTTEQLKTLTNEYKKLYDGLIQRNPFKAISDGVKEYKLAIANIQDIQRQLDFAIELGDDNLIAQIERDLTDAFDEAQKASTKLKKGVDAVGDQFSQAASDIQFFANALGFSEDSYATQFLNGMANAFKGVSIAIGFADIAMKIFDGTIKGMLASNPIGWILLAVSAIISAVQAIMNARINRINKEIESLEDKLDNLEYAYDRLQKSAERAFGTEYIQNYNRQLANLEAQVEAYEKQLDLERSKGKKADEEKIKEYQEQIRDTKDAIEDMYGSLSEHFLGQDLTSAARDFASAWIDAYKSFSNTTDAMKEKFQEMIQNMIVESLIAKVMERALKPVFDMVDNMGDSDFYSNSFWSQLMTEMNKATENGVVGAQNIMGMLESVGINLRDTGTGLTGISRDIASASEESILGLAAGINTQNFYISQVPTKLDTIIGLLRGGSAVVDSGVNVQDLITIQNQFLSHLPTIAQNTAETVARCERAAVACESMASKLGSVIKPKGTISTHSVNVTIGS